MASSDPPITSPGSGTHQDLAQVYSKIKQVNQEIWLLEQQIDRLASHAHATSSKRPVAEAYTNTKCSSKGLTENSRQNRQGIDDPYGLGVMESVRKIGVELGQATASKLALEDTLHALREIALEKSRRYVRNLNILDMPDEILLRTFEFVEGYDFERDEDPGGSDGRTAIKNSRLVCHKLCNVSSQRLVRLVRISFSESSLARLEQIACHPTIANGVRKVRVCLDFYSKSFTNVSQFISYHAEQLQYYIHVFDAMELWVDLGMADEARLEMIEEATAFASQMQRVAAVDYSVSDLDTAEDRACRKRLEEIYRHYLGLLEAQTSLVESGRFAHSVGCAMARMPRARTLEFDDFENESDMELMVPEVDIWERVARRMLLPANGYEAKKGELGSPDYRCIVQTIEAVRQSGIFLNSIAFKLFNIGAAGTLAPPAEIKRDVSSGMRHLKSLSLRCVDPRSAEEMLDLQILLATLLNTQSLERLYLDLADLQVGEPRLHVENILGSQTRPRLEHFSLRQATMDLSTLQTLLRRLPEKMKHFALERVYLKSGPWKEALDLLRAKRSDVMMLRDPCGPELTTMPPNDYQNIFGDGDPEPREHTDAEIYILGRSDCPNPIQALEDGYYADYDLI